MIVAESTYLLVQSAVSKDMTSIVVLWSPFDRSNIPWYRKGWIMRMVASAWSRSGEFQSERLPMVFLTWRLCFQGDQRQKVSQLSPISILALMLLERV